MTSGRILPQIILFSLPLAASGILQLLFNAADLIVVGKFAGSAPLAAVGATGSAVGLFVNAFLGISVGANVLVARHLGCRQEDVVNRIIHCAITLSAMLGCILLVAGQLFSIPLLRLMETPADVLPLSSLYMRIYFLGMPASLVYNFGAAILRAFGDTKRPFIFLAIAGVTNALLNLFFVLVLHMDVAGVALATVISQYISALLILRCLIRADGCGHLDVRKLRLNRRDTLSIVQIGLPAGLTSVIFNISNILIQSTVNSFGSSVIAANTAANNIEGFCYTACNSVYHAALTFTSQNLGAGKLDRIKRIFGCCILTVFILGLPLSLTAYFFGPQLLSIYTSKSDPSYATIIECGMIRIVRLSAIEFLCGWMDTCCGMVRGLGKSWTPMIVSVCGACVLRIVWIMTIFRLSPTLETLYLSYPISWAVTAAIHAVCFYFAYRKLLQRSAAPTPI
ncbi:MAG: MATE family efflux transporter [Clostridia bacterium]|nr:MATE family efflux transporter [Clostridia bacterium]